MGERTSYIYILTNKGNTTLYTGVTGNLEGRMLQHKSKRIEGFTKHDNVTKLVYYEEYESIEHAILREKRIKRWRRVWKEELIRSQNPNWEDLSAGWEE